MNQIIETFSSEWINVREMSNQARNGWFQRFRRALEKAGMSRGEANYKVSEVMLGQNK
jgi:hypothetical protein